MICMNKLPQQLFSYLFSVVHIQHLGSLNHKKLLSTSMVLQTWENFLKGLGLFIRDSYTPNTYYFRFKLIYFHYRHSKMSLVLRGINRSASPSGSEPSFPPSQGPAGWPTSPTATSGTITRDKILQLQPKINHPRGLPWHVLIPPHPLPPVKP